ncbi:MAG: tetratricopeptide repeat protein, partial [Verrucomicrobiia bacterium]
IAVCACRSDSVRMSDLQDQYDDAMFDFGMNEYDSCIEKLSALLGEDPTNFDAQLSLGMAFYRKEEYPRAIEEGHKAEKLKPNEQLVHTNLSLFYMKSGDKTTAEHHGLQARIASWKQDMASPGTTPGKDGDSELQMAEPKPQNIKIPDKFPDMPWKQNKKL